MYSTDVITTTNGNEQRNINWLKSRNYYELSTAINNPKDIETIITFFRLHRGKAQAFRFRDWTDYKVTDQILNSHGNGLNQYQLIKTYQLNKDTDVRLINKPVPNTIKITINGNECRGFTSNYDNGIITLLDKIPKNAVIRANFEFDVWVRFDTDDLKISSLSNADSNVRIPLIEVKAYE